MQFYHKTVVKKDPQFLSYLQPDCICVGTDYMGKVHFYGVPIKTHAPYGGYYSTTIDILSGAAGGSKAMTIAIDEKKPEWREIAERNFELMRKVID